MKHLTLSFIAVSLHLPQPQLDYTVKRITIDSRRVEKGDLFVALRGEKFDGHDFIPEILEKGAWALVSRADFAHTSGCLKVDNTLIALQKLAAAWRKQLNPMVFGITGSSGKTTVKEMLAAILRRRFGADAVLATEGNLNNHIGLPLTLLNLRPNHRYAVIEMGMNHAGELAQLTRIAQPNVALVNNAMRAHIGCGFDGIADIARAKSEIYQGLSENGMAIFPIEDAQADIFQAATKDMKTQTFGVIRGDLHAENIVLNALDSEFDAVYRGERARINLPVAGRHNIANACAAGILAIQAGVNLSEVAVGLATFANIKGRLQQKCGKRGGMILDDTYNANPDSMKAALDVLARLPAPRIFVMGDMGELGEVESAAMHAEIGEYARALGIESAYFVGDDSAQAAERFGERGLWFADKDPLIQVLLHELPERSSILVKGSRFMQMETVVAQLLDECSFDSSGSLKNPQH